MDAPLALGSPHPAHASPTPAAAPTASSPLDAFSKARGPREAERPASTARSSARLFPFHHQPEGAASALPVPARSGRATSRVASSPGDAVTAPDLPRPATP